MKNYIRLIGLCLLFYITATISSEAKNMTYQGKEILLDQPEGEVKYYDVNLEITRVYDSNEISTRSTELTVPFVFDDDKIYIRNLLGGFSLWGWPTWIKGKLVDGDIIIETGVTYEFSGAIAFDVLLFDSKHTPFYILKYSRLNSSEGVIEDLNDFKSITLKKNDSGFIINFGENEGINGFYFVTKFECYPSEFTPVIPPSGYKIEKYQINFNPYSSFIQVIKEKSASLLLNVIKTDKEIYIQGLSYIVSGNPEAWIKGEILGDKVIFKNGMPFGIGENGEIMYCTPVIIEHEYLEGMRTHHNINFLPTEELVMDYDPVSGKLSNPSCGLAFTSAPDQELKISDVEEKGLWRQKDIFAEMEMIRVPENITHEPCPMDGLKVDYLDKHGYMMNPEYLYVRLYEDSEPYEAEYVDFNIWTWAYGFVVPFGNTYFYNRYCLGGGGGDYINNFQEISLYNNIYSKNLKGILYYSEDGEIPDTLPDTGVTEIQNDMDSAQIGPSVIYDLTGRRYENKENLSPGLYIINGKKVKIK